MIEHYGKEFNILLYDSKCKEVLISSDDSPIENMSEEEIIDLLCKTMKRIYGGTWEGEFLS